MKAQDIIIRSARSLRQAKSRTILTSLAIAVGACSMMLSLAMGKGGGEYAQRIITANIEPGSLWVMKKQDDKATASRPSEYTGSPTIKFNKLSVQLLGQSDIDRLTAVEGVVSIEPAYAIDNAVVTRPGQKKYQANVAISRPGIRAVYEAGSGDQLDEKHVIIPDGYREALGFPDSQSAIGAMIQVTITNDHKTPVTSKTFTYTVQGVTQQSSMSLALAPTALLLSQSAVKQLNDYVVAGTLAEHRFVAASVHIENGESIDGVKQRIINQGYVAQTPGDVYGALYQFVGVLQLVLLGFGVLAVVTAIFGIVNTQYISVLERVQEVGLMKALGMGRSEVGRLFMLEAALIGLVGGVSGTLVAIVIGLILNPIVAGWLTLDRGTYLLAYEPLSAGGVVVALTLTSMAAGLFPARKAADLDPIEALRSDTL